MTTLPIEALEQSLRDFTQASLYLCAGELCQEDSRYVSERELMQRAVGKRRREFFSGRWLARQALGRAGLPVQAINRGPLGQPIWPRRVVGSITHDQCYGVAVVATADDVRGIGIDLLENPASVDRQITDLIMGPEEESLLIDRFPDLPATAVAFGMKESVVKAISPHIGQFMDMRDIFLIPSDQEICARVMDVPLDLPCIVMATHLGLLSASFFPGER